MVLQKGLRVALLISRGPGQLCLSVIPRCHVRILLCFLTRVLNNSLRLHFCGVFAEKVGVVLSSCIVMCSRCHEMEGDKILHVFFCHVT